MERLIRLLAANRYIKIQESDAGVEYPEDEEEDRFPAAVRPSGEPLFPLCSV